MCSLNFSIQLPSSYSILKRFCSQWCIILLQFFKVYIYKLFLKMIIFLPLQILHIILYIYVSIWLCALLLFAIQLIIIVINKYLRYPKFSDIFWQSTTSYKMTSSFLESLPCTACHDVDLGANRNKIASITSGFLFFAGTGIIKLFFFSRFLSLFSELKDSERNFECHKMFPGRVVKKEHYLDFNWYSIANNICFILNVWIFLFLDSCYLLFTHFCPLKRIHCLWFLTKLG